LPTIENKLLQGVYIVNGFQTRQIALRYYWTEGVANFIPFLLPDPRHCCSRRVVLDFNIAKGNYAILCDSHHNKKNKKMLKIKK
jgi:hypothetical protein